jgi:superfamily II DNA or RNA helicase
MDKYKKYEITDILKTMEEICFPKNKEFKLLPQQEFLPEYLYDNINNLDSLGLLIYHEIGSGKTCTAINIAEKFKDKMNIIVVLPAALIGNFRDELRSKCVNNTYISNKDRNKLLNPYNEEYIKIINKSDILIDKIYTIYSYHKFVKKINKGLINITNTLLIIDEIQNMISLKGKFYKSLKLLLNNALQDTKVILLSATPIFDIPNEIALTLNLLKPKITFPIGELFDNKFMKRTKNFYIPKNIDLFKEMCTGLISYYRGDLPISYPENRTEIIKCDMSNHQLNIYKQVREKEKNKYKKTINFPNNFLIGSRMVSNITYPNSLMGDLGYNSINDALSNMAEYSCKFVKLYEKIKESNGPIFIYSNFLNTGGLKPLIDYLEYNKYKNFKKYEEGNNRFAIYSGNESLEERENIKKIFNQYDNYDGSKIKILLGSPSTKEGISLLRVNQVHILEPHWNLSRIKQIIGRAIRFCSHKDLPENKRYVNVYIYLAISQDLKQSVDEYIWSIAKEKYRLINEFNTAMKTVAIDYNLFDKINNLPNNLQNEKYKLV